MRPQGRRALHRLIAEIPGVDAHDIPNNQRMSIIQNETRTNFQIKACKNSFDHYIWCSGLNTTRFFDYFRRTCITIISSIRILFVCIDFPFQPMISHAIPE